MEVRASQSSKPKETRVKEIRQITNFTTIFKDLVSKYNKIETVYAENSKQKLKRQLEISM